MFENYFIGSVTNPLVSGKAAETTLGCFFEGRKNISFLREKGEMERGMGKHKDKWKEKEIE